MGHASKMTHSTASPNHPPVSFMPIMTMRATGNGQDAVSHGACQQDDTQHGEPKTPTRQLHAHHDHAGHPEEEDVVTRLQQRGGVELGEVGGLVGPAKHCKTAVSSGRAELGRG